MDNIYMITGEETIRGTLTQFKACLPSLSSGAIDMDAMVQKLSQYACVIVLKDGCAQKGFAAFYCNNQTTKIAYLTLIAVDADFRGMGLGRTLLEAVCRISKENGMQSIDLEVRKDNSAAIALYQRNGFRFHADKIETIMMQRAL